MISNCIAIGEGACVTKSNEFHLKTNRVDIRGIMTPLEHEYISGFLKRTGSMGGINVMPEREEMQNITHAEAVVEYEILKRKLEEHKLYLRTDYKHPTGRLFFISDQNEGVERKWEHAFSCTSIQELGAWYRGWAHAKGVQI